MTHKIFEVDFIKRSLEIIEQYDKHVIPNVPPNNQYEVTLLINCLLGLLVLPKERRRNRIPDTPIADLNAWGINREHIIDAGKDCVGRQRNVSNLTLLELTTDLRNSIAHILFRTLGDGEHISHVEFSTNRSGFKAKIPVNDFRVFVTKLATMVVQDAAPAHNKQQHDAGIKNHG